MNLKKMMFEDYKILLTLQNYLITITFVKHENVII